MPKKSPFAIQKALVGIGGEPESVKRLRSGDLHIETNSALQTKSFLLAKSFLTSPLTVSPHKTLNSCRGVISEPDLLTTPDAEILDGFSNQGVIQVRRITIKKDTTVITIKHIILTFSSPNLPKTIKAGYLNCKIRPYIPNPLRCFKCQRFGHSQTSCRGQLTCSRCASAGHASTDCILEPKYARKLIVPQLSETYAQAAKSSTLNHSTQTDENLKNKICPPIKLLEPLSSKPRLNISIPTPDISRSSSIQAQLLSSSSSIAATNSEPQPPIPASNDAPSTNDMFTRIESSFSIIPISSSKSFIQPPSGSNTVQDVKIQHPSTSNTMAPYRRRKPASSGYTTDEEDMITYDVEEDEIKPNPGLVEKDGKQYWK
ncbi:uncharacterized protein TNCV_3945441 [Trichonephila clavipes]|nr:uncharacterized protein TNCV_3945441 [Trichonephila clavipes]